MRGSSSIRFALFNAGDSLRRGIAGKIERTSVERDASDVRPAPEGQEERAEDVPSPPAGAARFLLEWLERRGVMAEIAAVGHRVVHGMRHSEPERVTPELIEEIKRIRPFDPEHLTQEIALIEAICEAPAGVGAGGVF